MRRRAMIVTAVSAAALFVGGAVAADKTDSAQAGPAKMCGDKDAMMKSMPMHGIMQGDVAKLADQLAASLAAIQAEKDPAALQQKLAAHEALIKELQAKAGHMGMQNMMMGDKQDMPNGHDMHDMYKK